MAIPEVLLLEPVVHKDDRGYFMETFRKSFFDERGLHMDFVQDNQSMSKKGALKAAIVNLQKNNINIEEIKKKVDEWRGLENLDLAKSVSTKKEYTLNESNWNHELKGFTFFYQLGRGGSFRRK